MANINVYGTFNSMAEDQTVAKAAQIFDDVQEKTQETINSETSNRISNLNAGDISYDQTQTPDLGNGDVQSAVEALNSQKVEYTTIGGNNVQLKNGHGELLMPNVGQDNMYTSDFQIEDDGGNILASIDDGEIITSNFNSEDCPNTIDVLNDSFSLADEKGNAIVEFSNGHIRTKYFDSSNSSDVQNVKLGGDEICDYFAINSSGVAVQANGYGCSHYIDCLGCADITLTMIRQSSPTYGLAFYNESKTFMSFVANESGTTGKVTKTISVPIGAHYFRTTYWDYANSKTYGEFECEITYNGLLGDGNKRPYQSGVIYFSPKVNQTFYDASSASTADMLSEDKEATTGALLLPPTYSKNGNKTKLIVYSHGYSHYVYYGKWGNTDEFLTQKQHWANMGFAVLGCNGAKNTGYSSTAGSGANNFASAPQNVSAFHKCVEYAVNHYNIDPEVYVVGGSMGGVLALQYAYTFPSEVRVLLLIAGHCSTLDWISLSGNVKADLWGLTGNLTTTIVNNDKDKYLGYIHDWRFLTINTDTYNFDITMPVYGLIGGDDPNTVIRNSMDNLFGALRKAGKEAIMRVISGKDHSIVSGADVNVDEEVGNIFKRY